MVIVFELLPYLPIPTMVKCLDFLTKKKYDSFIIMFTNKYLFSAISSVNFVISLIDLSFALMAIPNRSQ